VSNQDGGQPALENELDFTLWARQQLHSQATFLRSAPSQLDKRMTEIWSRPATDPEVSKQ